MKKYITGLFVLVLSAYPAFSQNAAPSAAVQKADAEVQAVVRSMDTTVTTTSYDVTEKNKRGTANYGEVTQTVNGEVEDSYAYASYDPSRSSLANDKAMEISYAFGGSYSTNEAKGGKKYGKTGMGTGVNMLFKLTPNLGMGLDYMFLNPDGREYDTQAVNFHQFRAHNIAVAGKYTVNAWDNLRLYVPFGVGMMNARLKTDAGAASTSSDKWGASMYAGVGVQYDFCPVLFAGLEYRYVYSFISDKHLSNFGKDDNLQFHDVFLRVGMRF